MATKHLLFLTITGLLFTGCIETPKDVVDQYEYQGPISFANYFMEYFPKDDLWNTTIQDSILSRVESLPLSQIIEFGDIIKESPVYQYFPTINISRHNVMEHYRNLDMTEGIDFYQTYTPRHSIIGEVFRDSIFPILINAPYPLLKNIHSKLQDSELKSKIEEKKQEVKPIYLADIKDDIEICKLNAIETYDLNTLSMIQLAIDSLAESNIKDIKGKLSGGFLDYKTLISHFKLNDEYISKIWNEKVKSDKYQEIISSHINSTLTEVNIFQQEYYKDLTGKNWEYNLPVITAPPVNLAVPKLSLELFTQFLNKELVDASMDDPLSILRSPLNQVMEGIVIAGTTVIDIVEAVEGELSPEEKLSAYIHSEIMKFFPDEYHDSLRRNFINIIETSYNTLYKDIENEL